MFFVFRDSYVIYMRYGHYQRFAYRYEYACTICNLTKRLEAAPKKAAAVRILILISIDVQVRRKRHWWGSKDVIIRDFLQWTSTHGHTSFGWSAKIYIHQFCVNNGCCQENRSRVMAHRDGWWERVKGIFTVITIWWWLLVGFYGISIFVGYLTTNPI